MFMQNHHPFTLELTVLSAEGLKPKSCGNLFSHRRLRPFISLTTSINGDNDRRRYKTTVGDKGCTNPTWEDKFHIPLDSTFFANRYSSIYLQLFTKRLIVGPTQLGWCRIPASDIAIRPVGSVRFLSYRLRDKDGTRGPGIVNLKLKLEGLGPVAADQGLSNSMSPTVEACHTVIGIPVTGFPFG